MHRFLSQFFRAVGFQRLLLPSPPGWRACLVALSVVSLRGVEPALFAANPDPSIDGVRQKIEPSPQTTRRELLGAQGESPNANSRPPSSGNPPVSSNGGNARHASSVPSGHLTLADVIDAVRVRNPGIQAARSRVRAALRRVPQEQAWEDPALVVEKNVEGDFDQSLKLQQTFPLSGRNVSRGRVAMAEARSAEQDLRQTTIEALRTARTAYFRYAGAAELLSLNARTTETLRQVADAARSRFEVGTETQVNILMAEAELAKVQEARVDLEQMQTEAEAELTRQMFRASVLPLPKPAPIPAHFAPVRTLDLLALQAHAVQHSPDVRRARTEMAVAKAKLELAQRGWVPDPMAAVKGRRFVEAGEKMSEVAFEVSLALPWANTGKLNAAVQEARAEIAAREAAIASEKSAAEAHVRVAVSKAEAFLHHVTLYREKIIPLSEQALTAARLGYETGRTLLLDILTADRKLREDQTDAVKHWIEYQTAMAEIQAATGMEEASVVPFHPPAN
jgi:cobalt-zinc-cadmium efflux system outer membrane protein